MSFTKRDYKMIKHQLSAFQELIKFFEGDFDNINEIKVNLQKI